MRLRTGSELINPFRVLERVGIRERMRVVDMGCGALGHFVFPAAQLVGPRGKVYGVDILKEVLDILARRMKEDQYNNVEAVWADMDVYRATRVPEGEMDLTILANNIFLSEHRPHLVKELARITKKGGRVLVIDWVPTATVLGPPADRRLPQSNVKQLFKVPEFTFEEEFEAGKAHYALVFTRTDADVIPPKD
ncbi:methyltransferase domain-containing protein [Candidatus Uhrbacteria bacterium]|nr:methyltransferase domain-containing protein [Candidatus Uhrbacteria bacterium]MBD3284455.1 methyltransferase domain-containing protein [Candidatus Uhrbacteria bacterium]